MNDLFLVDCSAFEFLAGAAHFFGDGEELSGHGGDVVDEVIHFGDAGGHESGAFVDGVDHAVVGDAEAVEFVKRVGEGDFSCVALVECFRRAGDFPEGSGDASEDEADDEGDEEHETEGHAELDEELSSDGDEEVSFGEEDGEGPVVDSEWCDDGVELFAREVLGGDDGGADFVFLLIISYLFPCFDGGAVLVDVVDVFLFADEADVGVHEAVAFGVDEDAEDVVAEFGDMLVGIAVELVDEPVDAQFADESSVDPEGEHVGDDPGVEFLVIVWFVPVSFFDVFGTNEPVFVFEVGVGEVSHGGGAVGLFDGEAEEAFSAGVVPSVDEGDA